MSLSGLARRFASSLAAFVVITIGVFGLVHAAPGDPVRMRVDPASVTQGGSAVLEQRRHDLGLDNNVAVQYLDWMKAAWRGDFGYSYVTGEKVAHVLLERLWPTVELLSASLLIALVVGVACGIMAAVRHNRATDYVIAGFSLAAVSVPPFFLAIAAIYVFSLRLGVLPSSGLSEVGNSSVFDGLRHLVLPSLTIGLSFAGPIARYVRSGLLTELRADYILSAKARGASRSRVVFRHAFRNALVPLVTVVALTIPMMLAGTIVVEQVFAWPGLGQLAIASITQNDYPVIIGFALLSAALILVCNFLADVVYTVVDPRVRL